MTELSALSAVPAAARDAVLKFYFGPMDCGKSHAGAPDELQPRTQGRRGLVLTKHDRSGGPKVTSRIGLGLDAIEVDDSLDLVELVRGHDRIDYLICDEACFYTMEQIEQLADPGRRARGGRLRLRPGLRLQVADVPAAQRLFELATRCAGCRSRCCAGAGGQGC
ncbi:hypothetical protein [Nonomuraea dietziae]|uniref:hypothetical protein n=1 Tax=Nonomuraea dietziae TaxID=65515 RepID=UPI0031DF2894